MKYFVNILKQFTQAQRLIVLILLLSFTTGSYLLSQYLKTDDCRPFIEENLKMHNDFAKISEMLRLQRLKENQIQLDTVLIGGMDESKIIQLPDNSSNNIMDSIYKIAQSNK
jgi:hypothetical protein